MKASFTFMLLKTPGPCVEGLKMTKKKFKNNHFLNAFKAEPSFSHPTKENGSLVLNMSLDMMRS